MVVKDPKILDLQFPKEWSIFYYEKNDLLATPFSLLKTRSQVFKCSRAQAW